MAQGLKSGLADRPRAMPRPPGGSAPDAVATPSASGYLRAAMVSAPVTAPARPHPLGAFGQLVGSPYLLLVYAVIFWCGNGLVGRAFGPDISPITLSFWRWTVAFAVTVPFTGRAVWRVRTLIPRHWRLLVLYALLGLVGCNVTTYWALHDTTAVNSSLMNSATPIFVML